MKPYKVIVSPLIMEEWFIIAEILAESYDRPYVEYGLVGLTTLKTPFRIAATCLLPDQKVSSVSVYQSGRDMFNLRKEVRLLSKKAGERLIQTVFIHRHPGSCDMSSTDIEFVTTTFSDLVSAVQVFKEKRQPDPDELDCYCFHKKPGSKKDAVSTGDDMEVEFSVCFSIIVNRERDYSINAARKTWCPICQRPAVRLVPAELEKKSDTQVSDSQLKKLKSRLELEIENKIMFESKQFI